MVQGIAGAFAVRIPISYFVSRIPGVSSFYDRPCDPCLFSGANYPLRGLFLLAGERAGRPGPSVQRGAVPK